MYSVYCYAVDEMNSSGNLKRYNYRYDDLESNIDKIIDDFLEMMEYFDSFDANWFIKANINSNFFESNNKPENGSELLRIYLNQINL